MKKSIICIMVVALSLFLLSFCAAAASGSDLTFELNDDGNSYYVSCCDKSAQGELMIPAKYNGKTVADIGYKAFENCRNLTSITIPEGITSIGRDAFRSCTSLTRIIIPDSVTSIGNRAFNATGYIMNGSNWENGVLYIGNHLIGAEESIKSCDIRQGIKTIASGAFSYCTSLASITIPNSVTTIGSYAFEHCSGLTSITIPEGVALIGDGAFEQCYGLTNIIVPDSVTSIGEGAFLECTSLISIIIPDSVTAIGSSVFEGCARLENIVIPISVTSINSDAFEDCWCLADVYYGGVETQWEKINIGYNECLVNATIHFKSCDHKNTEIYPQQPPTCTKNGYTSGTYCYDCESWLVNREEHPAIGHKLTTLSASAATCTKTGLTEGSHCSVCKAVIKKQETIAKKSHTYTTSTTKATLKKNGKTVSKCSGCKSEKTETIYFPKSIKLSTTTLAYNGKNQTPSVTVKDSNGKIISKENYTVTYPKKRKAIGKYTVTVTFKGNYSGTKKLTFEIVPAKVSLSKVSAGKKQLTANWKTVSGATGYEVMYSTSKKFTKKTTKTVNIKKAKTKKTTIKKLKKGKKYYVKVRAYKTVSGKKIYGAYSAVKNIKVK